MIANMRGGYVIVAHGMRKNVLRLQPWRYLHEISRRFARNRPVVIITDSDDKTWEEDWLETLKVVYTTALSPRRSAELTKLINRFEPSQVWWSTTPRSVAYWHVWRKLQVPVTTVITCPLYTWRELIRALIGGVPWSEVGVLIHQRVIPRCVLRRALTDSCVSRVVTQSKANRNVLVSFGVPSEKIRVIPVGIDDVERVSVGSEMIGEARRALGFSPDAKVFVYLGALRRIRGIYTLLDAFRLVVHDSSTAHLAILARGADEEECTELIKYCERSGIAHRVKVIGGWLTRDELFATLDASDVVTLPFVLVPSDVPIAILEALARGKPVIGSNVDGIPELVRGRGAVVDPIVPRDLAQAILRFSESEDGIERMAQAALTFMTRYPNWDDVSQMALKDETA